MVRFTVAIGVSAVAVSVLLFVTARAFFAVERLALDAIAGKPVPTFAAVREPSAPCAVELGIDELPFEFARRHRFVTRERAFTVRYRNERIGVYDQVRGDTPQLLGELDASETSEALRIAVGALPLACLEDHYGQPLGAGGWSAEFRFGSVSGTRTIAVANTCVPELVALSEAYDRFLPLEERLAYASKCP